MDNQNYIEKIERYALGQMSGSESKSFEKELSTNSELSLQYSVYQLSLDAIEIDVEKNLRNDLESWSKESSDSESINEPKVVPFRRQIFQFAAAASVLLLVGFFGWNYMQSSPSTGIDYANYYNSPVISELRDSNTSDLAWQAALDNFENSNYQKAINSFESIEVDAPRFDEAQYLSGHAKVALKDYNAALRNFKTVKNLKVTKFKDKAEWNYILCLLRINPESMEGKTLLEKIAKSDHSFSQQAEEILSN